MRRSANIATNPNNGHSRKAATGIQEKPCQTRVLTKFLKSHQTGRSFGWPERHSFSDNEIQYGYNELLTHKIGATMFFPLSERP